MAASCAIPTATRFSWPMTRLLDLSQEVGEVTPGVIALRRELHQHPELAFEEVRTASTLAGRMRALGLSEESAPGGASAAPARPCARGATVT